MENISKCQFIKTESGSIYEIDEAHSRARRLTGNGPPTTRVGETWREYVDIQCIVGQPMLLVWEYVVENSSQMVAKSTLTSTVIDITNNQEVQ